MLLEFEALLFIAVYLPSCNDVKRLLVHILMQGMGLDHSMTLVMTWQAGGSDGPPKNVSLAAR